MSSHRGREPERHVEIAGGLGTLECYAELVAGRTQTSDPARQVGNIRVDLGQLEEEVGMPAVGLIVWREGLRGQCPDRCGQSVPKAVVISDIDADEAVSDESAQRWFDVALTVGRIREDRGRLVEPEGPGEDARLLQQLALRWPEQTEAPGKRRSHRPVARRRIEWTERKGVDGFAQPSLQGARREVVEASRGELDRERVALQATADPRDDGASSSCSSNDGSTSLARATNNDPASVRSTSSALSAPMSGTVRPASGKRCSPLIRSGLRLVARIRSPGQRSSSSRMGCSAPSTCSFSEPREPRADGKASAFFACVDALFAFDKPLLAAVQGVAVGGGCTLAVASDIVYVGESVRMRLPFANLGLVPEIASSYTLQANVGRQRAAELMFSAEWIDAERAIETGLAVRRFPDDRVVEEALAKAREIAQWPVSSLRAIKQTLQAAHRAGIEAARKIEDESMMRLAGTPENIEAITAFVQKRKPDFKQFRKR